MIGVGLFSPLFSPFCGSADGSVFSSWSINRTEIFHNWENSVEWIRISWNWICIDIQIRIWEGKNDPTKIEDVKEKFMF
jgi:hypothetical protein